jgi:hypothetical protein
MLPGESPLAEGHDGGLALTEAHAGSSRYM